MATTALAPQTNGIPPSSSGGQIPATPAAPSSQPPQAAPSTQTQTQTPSQQTLVNGTSNATSQALPSSQQQHQQQQQQQQHQQQQQQQHQNHAQQQNQAGGGGATAPRPRDVRTLELLLTAQGVTAFEPRVPVLLLDFAYRHTQAVLSDALHLAADPYTTHAGSKPSAAQGATASAPSGADAAVTASSVQVALSSRLAFQFHGGGSGSAAVGPGGGGGGGGASKEYLLETARERNRAALPRIMPHEWGVRLPSERFVLTGTSWGLADRWAPGEAGIEDDDDDDDDDDVEMGEAGADAAGDVMDGVAEGAGRQARADDEEVGGEPVEGGTVDDVFGNDVDQEMADDE